MLDKLSEVEKRYEEIEHRLYDPSVVADVEQYRQLMKESAALQPIVEKYREYTAAKRYAEEARGLLDGGGLDKEMRELAEQELAENREKAEACAEELKLLLLPRDPNDDRNVIVEIRAGAGGEESALFANSLQRMYTMYAERRGFGTEVMNRNETELGGCKEVSFSIEGQGAYSRLKYESGVHRVQRIPVTESNGKRQTSTATVAVLPEAQEVDVKINPDDLRIDVYRASGHGGQYINKTDSAVRITHIPSGIVVTCQDEKSQLKNKEKAMRVLRARLYEKMQEEKDAAYASDRRAQVGTGERSERIRTYNFNEGRVTDHRIGKTIYTIDAFVDGDMDDIIDPLIYADQQEQLRALGQGELQRG